HLLAMLLNGREEFVPHRLVGIAVGKSRERVEVAVCVRVLRHCYSLVAVARRRSLWLDRGGSTLGAPAGLPRSVGAGCGSRRRVLTKVGHARYVLIGRPLRSSRTQTGVDPLHRSG